MAKNPRKGRLRRAKDAPTPTHEEWLLMAPVHLPNLWPDKVETITKEEHEEHVRQANA